MMVDSQNEATAAALTELGYDVNAKIIVHSFTDDSGGEGHPRGRGRHHQRERHAGDGCRHPAQSRERCRGRPVEMLIERSGAAQTVSVTPKQITVDGTEGVAASA